jgi:hypothetical protein
MINFSGEFGKRPWFPWSLFHPSRINNRTRWTCIWAMLHGVCPHSQDWFPFLISEFSRLDIEIPIMTLIWATMKNRTNWDRLNKLLLISFFVELFWLFYIHITFQTLIIGSLITTMNWNGLFGLRNLKLEGKKKHRDNSQIKLYQT